MSVRPQAISRATAVYPPELLDACRRGESAALERVFVAESPALERVLGRIVGPGADLDDLLQATFEAAIHAFPRFRGEATVRTWLTRIAVRTAMAHLKHPSRKRRVELELVSDHGAPPALEAAPSDQAEARQRLERFYEHLQKLDARKRTAFVLHVIEGRSMEEIAALMGAGVSTTKSRVFWARRALLGRLRKDPQCRDWLGEYMSSEEAKP